MRYSLLIVLLLNLIGSVSANSTEDQPQLKQLSTSTSLLAPSKPKLLFVVDDLGDNSIIAKKLIQLPAQLTLAILPHTPHAKKIAEQAQQNGHEVIMHLPMEAKTRPDLLGPGAIYSHMAQAEIDQLVRKNARSIPYLVGFNNHMGSLLTENREKMNGLMQLAKNKSWYFIDSKTSETSVAQKVAKEIGIPTIGRDIFLDHHVNETGKVLDNMMLARLAQAKKIALKRGYVVIICHPYPETLAFLRQQLPSLNQQFDLKSVGHILNPIQKLAKIESVEKKQDSVEKNSVNQKDSNDTVSGTHSSK